MAAYFVNASGSNTPPYDSSNAGALNFGNLLASGVDDNAVINVVQNGGVIDDSTNTVAAITKSVTIQSDSGNTSKPSILVNNESPLLDFTGGDATTLVVQDLILNKPGPDATANFIQFGDYAIDSLQITGCEFGITDTSGADARGIFFSDNTITDGTISGNSFSNLTDGVYSLGAAGGASILTIVDGHYNNMRNFNKML